MNNTFEYFAGEYTKYRALEGDQQAICAEYNEEIQKSLDSTRTLRQLYIDLCICDELITALSAKKVMSQRDHNGSFESMSILLVQKLAAQKMIKEREDSKESVIPDAGMERKLKECADLPHALAQWLPDLPMKKIWKRTHKLPKHDRGRTLIQSILDEEIRRNHFNFDRLRYLVDVIECIYICSNQHY